MGRKMTKLEELLKIDERERRRLEEEEKEVKGGERAMALAVLLTVALGLMVVWVILASFVEALK